MNISTYRWRRSTSVTIRGNLPRSSATIREVRPQLWKFKLHVRCYYDSVDDRSFQTYLNFSINNTNELHEGYNWNRIHPCSGPSDSRNSRPATLTSAYRLRKNTLMTSIWCLWNLNACDVKNAQNSNDSQLTDVGPLPRWRYHGHVIASVTCRGT